MLLVVKAGGRVLSGNLEGVVEDAAELARRGFKVVFVHGGGDWVTEYSKRMGVEPKFVVSPSGIRSRYTDEEEIKVYAMVMAGLLNKMIVAGLERRGVHAVGLSGVDGGVLKARRKKQIVVVDERGRKRLIPGGYTGKIIGVNSQLVRQLLDSSYTVVVAPLALGEEGELLNVDGDQAAAALAKALGADKLILLSDVEGVLVDGKLVEDLDAASARELASRIGPGMNRKLLMAAEAVEAGVGEVVIGSGLAEKPISRLLEGAPATRVHRGAPG